MVIEHINMYRLYQDFDLQADYFSILAKTLLFFAGLVLVLALIMGFFLYLTRQTVIVMSRLIEYDLRKLMYDHYQTLGLDFYKRNNTGDLMSRVTEDVNKVRMYLGPAVMYLANLISTIALVIVAMLAVSPKLTMYTLLPLPFLAVSIYYVSHLIHTRSTLIQQQLSKLTSIAQEVFSGIRVVKSYVREPQQVAFFAQEADQYKEKSMDLAKIDAWFFPLMIFMIGASTILTVYIGGRQVIAGEITAGNIAEFVIYVGMLTWPVTAIGWIASIVQQASASQKRINEFLETKPSIDAPEVAPLSPTGTIRFENVGFVYPDTGIRALEGINFELKAGERLAIIGRTGAGKSTIADLLVRMYDPTEGRITIGSDNEIEGNQAKNGDLTHFGNALDPAIDWQDQNEDLTHSGNALDLRKYNLSALRSGIGYVPQDVFLFSDTIAANIAFGLPEEPGREQIEEYAAYASIHKEISELPNGYDTLVGERGVTLSGGQKQRVSIARALIKQPDIILLDDCLSAVDTNTEQEILGYLNQQLADKSAIIITHRIYSHLKFDKIIVLEDGRIAEMGTHEELVKSGGYYSEIFERQLAGEEV